MRKVRHQRKEATKSKQTTPGVLNRRQVLKYGLCGGLTLGIAQPLRSSASASMQKDIRPTNVILISIDTLRAKNLGCYGYHRPTTPNLDGLSSQGLLFEDVTATSPWTLPSHASLLSGLYPVRHGLKSESEYLPPDVVTLPQLLKNHGFFTAAFVNSFYLSRRFGLDQGFDKFTYVREFWNQKAPSNVGGEALRWLSKHNGSPFFLFLHYFDVHSDYSSLPRYERQFVRPYTGIANGTTRQLLDFREGTVLLNKADGEHLIDLYDAGIRQMDHGIGRLLRSLEESKLADNSLVIVTSDHGEEFLEHGGILHSRTQYQEVVHVPLIMRGPAIPSSERLANAVSLVDVMPTILALLGLEKPYILDGFDLKGLWQKSTPPPKRYIFAEASKYGITTDERDILHDTKRAVRHPRYKLHYNRLTKKTELYDLIADREEKKDVSSEHTQLVDSMLSELKDFMNIRRKGKPIPPLSPKELQRLKSLGYI